MAKKDASDLNSKPLFSGNGGNAGVFYGTLTDTPATGDEWRLCKLPAGMKVTAVVIKNADLGTAAPADIGYAPVDGSAGDADAFAAAVALGTANAGGILPQNGVEVPKDSYLTLTFGTIDTGASGAVHVSVYGELFGAK